MKTTFDLKTWMTENREVVIEKYNKLINEPYFNGITLKDFMIQIYNLMQVNNPKSDKRCNSLLPFVMGQVYFNNSKVLGNDKVTDDLRNRYNGTSAMALV